MLSLVRVSYIASAVAVLVGAVIWLPRLGVAAWPRVLRLASVALIGAVVFSFTGVGENTLTVIEQRIGSLGGNSARPGDQSAIDLRAQWTSVMLRRLGGDWPVGTGFIHKKDRLLPGVPSGDPRNGDIGGISMYLAIGLIGVLVMAALLVGTALACFRGVGKKPELPAPLEVPVMIATSLFCVYLAVSGATLGQMYMPTTVGFVSILLALGLAPAANRLSSKSNA
jgi:hypothetical protein